VGGTRRWGSGRRAAAALAAAAASRNGGPQRRAHLGRRRGAPHRVGRAIGVGVVVRRRLRQPGGRHVAPAHARLVPHLGGAAAARAAGAAGARARGAAARRGAARRGARALGRVRRGAAGWPGSKRPPRVLALALRGRGRLPAPARRRLELSERGGDLERGWLGQERCAMRHRARRAGLRGGRRAAARAGVAGRRRSLRPAPGARCPATRARPRAGRWPVGRRSQHCCPAAIRSIRPSWLPHGPGLRARPPAAWHLWDALPAPTA
jgi:hypothetical protein